jgi:hypothetical protein
VRADHGMEMVGLGNRYTAVVAHEAERAFYALTEGGLLCRIVDGVERVETTEVQALGRSAKGFYYLTKNHQLFMKTASGLTSCGTGVEAIAPGDGGESLYWLTDRGVLYKTDSRGGNQLVLDGVVHLDSGQGAHAARSVFFVKARGGLWLMDPDVSSGQPVCLKYHTRSVLVGVDGETLVCLGMEGGVTRGNLRELFDAQQMPRFRSPWDPSPKFASAVLSRDGQSVLATSVEGTVLTTSAIRD